MTDALTAFSGSIPEYYDRCLGPIWLDALAAAVAARVPRDLSGAVLEIACGTGLLTRHLRERLDPRVQIVATDISKPMLEYAQAKLGAREGLAWSEADANALAYPGETFDAVACALGLMFMPDRERALREMRRVLRRNGILVFSVWDRIEKNPTAIASAVMESLLPGDPEVQAMNVAFSMHDRVMLRDLLTETGFGEIHIDAVSVDATADPHTLATGMIRGTPRSVALQQRGVDLDDVVNKIASALAGVGGRDPYRGTANAIVVNARAI